MVKHIVMWKLLDSFSIDEKQEITKTFKDNLEALDNLMEGVFKISVINMPLESSNVDILLDSEFADIATLEAYQIHPEHQKVASYLKGKVVSRNCMDYII